MTRTSAQPLQPAAKPRMEAEDHYRAPSQYPRCRRPRCHQPPVADLNRGPHPRTGRPLWYAYCTDDLAGYNREVRADGRVWWRGAQVGAEYACGNCQQIIRLAPGAADPEAEDGPYWYHTAGSSIWCDGWGDPTETGREATPA